MIQRARVDFSFAPTGETLIRVEFHFDADGEAEKVAKKVNDIRLLVGNNKMSLEATMQPRIVVIEGTVSQEVMDGIQWNNLTQQDLAEMIRDRLKAN